MQVQADCLPDPGDVFKFLKEHGIGQGHALFYIAYATFLELRGNYAAADNVYQQGINRLATPMDRLKAKFDEFQHRMARRIQRKAQEQTSALGGGDEERQSLGVLGGRRSLRSGPGLGGGGAGGGGGGVGVGGRQKRKAVGTPGRENAGGNNGLDIFVDEEFGTNADTVVSAPPSFAPAVAAASSSSSSYRHQQPQPHPQWSTLPTFEQARKENTQKAASWAGQRMKQNKTFIAAPPGPTLDIPLDPEFALVEQQQQQNHVSLRQRLDRTGAVVLDEQLSHDPLHLHRVGQGGAQEQTTTTTTAKREEVLMCDVDALVDTTKTTGDKGEVSFEERRAQQWMAKKNEQEEKRETPFNQPATTTTLMACGKQKEQQEQPATTAAAAAAAAAASLHSSSSEVTLTTKDAFDAINAAFGSRFGGDMPTLATGEDVANMTMATKDAFAAINTMFGNKSSSFNSSFNSDVTLTTKAAFEALNAAFGGPSEAGPHPRPPPPPPQQQQLGSLFIRQDTSLRGEHSGNTQEEHPALAGLDIREDTIFLGGVLGNRREEEDALPDTVTRGLRNHGGTAAVDDGGGLSIREDTIFINGNGGGNSNTGMFDIREDTVFISGGVPTTNENENSVSVPKIDETMPVRAANRTLGLAPRHTDHDQENNPPPQPAVSAGISEHMQGLELSNNETSSLEGGEGVEMEGGENDENAAPPSEPVLNNNLLEHPSMRSGGGGGGRRRRRSATASDVLAPLLTVAAPEEDEESMPLAQLPSAAPNTQLDDDFEVFESDTEGIVVEPFSSGFQSHMLRMLSPPVDQWPNVTTLPPHQESAALKVFQKFVKKQASIDATATAVVLGDGSTYTIQGRVGSGAYATVYQANESLALKVELPPCPWEWYMYRVVGGRSVQCTTTQTASALYLGAQSSIMVMPRGMHGSLQDLLNVYLARGERPDEAVVCALTAALMRLMGRLHHARILHNDVKPDNVLVHVNAQTGDVSLQLIDFGRGVDLELLPQGSYMHGDSGTDGFRCVEMREGRPWVYQSDVYCTAGVVHCLLFGEYMQVERVMDSATGETFLRSIMPFKRYWHVNVWKSVFDGLLNCRGSAPPDWNGLAETVEGMYGGDGNGKGHERTRVELKRLVHMLST